MRRIVGWSALGLVVLVGAVLLVLNKVVLPANDAKFNPVLNPPPYPVPAEVRAVHDAAFVADLHADPLLWGRDLTRRYDRGQIDLPRLVEGGVDLQVFGVVTQSPKGQNVDRNTAETDRLPLLFFATLRPPAAWKDPWARALAQAREWDRLAARSGGTLVPVRTRADLDAFAADPARQREAVAGLLALEGMHPLAGDPARLEVLFAAGFRMMAAAHFFDSAVGDSAHGVRHQGLTDLGRALVPRMEALGITIDLAHADPGTIDDTLALATKPVVVSHTGVQATCPGPRTLSDDHLRAIAANGGVIGIGYFDHAVCDVSVAGIVAAIRHVAEVVGPEHVALGSDFDGAVQTPFDTTGVPLITEALLDAGFTPDEVGAILGGNVLRVLRANLPETPRG